VRGLEKRNSMKVRQRGEDVSVTRSFRCLDALYLPMTNHDLRMISGRHGTLVFLPCSWASRLERTDMIFKAYCRPLRSTNNMHPHMVLIIGW